MVSSSHPAASFAGARVLADGGNAIDATSGAHDYMIRLRPGSHLAGFTSSSASPESFQFLLANFIGSLLPLLHDDFSVA